MGSIVGHRIAYKGVGVPRGQRHIPSKTWLKYTFPSDVESCTLWVTTIILELQTDAPYPNHIPRPITKPNESNRKKNAFKKRIYTDKNLFYCFLNNLQKKIGILSICAYSAQVVETSVNTNNSPSQDYTTNPDDHSNHNIDSPGFKPFTVIITSNVVVLGSRRRKTVHYWRCFFPEKVLAVLAGSA